MTVKKKKRTIVYAVVAAFFITMIIWIVWGNTSLELNTYIIKSEKLPDQFEGYRIAHVSDLHNTEMGNNNKKLLLMLRDAKPNIIVITGDLIDSRRTNVDIALQFVEEAVKIAPCYYVTGNHESRISLYDKLRQGLIEVGAVVLEDERLEIERSGESITMIGVNDPNFQTDYVSGDSETVMQHKLKNLISKKDGFIILLSHRPELFNIYVESNIDLVFSGHAHGGQFQLPFVGGLVAPNQGWFPKYDTGLYIEENTNMIVSRGIGNSLFPFRVNNRPEVILVELKADS